MSIMRKLADRLLERVVPHTTAVAAVWCYRCRIGYTCPECSHTRCHLSQRQRCASCSPNTQCSPWEYNGCCFI